MPLTTKGKFVIIFALRLSLALLAAFATQGCNRFREDAQHRHLAARVKGSRRVAAVE